ncbi:hypothetical protein Syun_024881 [Stephania yunnanensis]|uniref:Uncharacterized protein n=1 Tax=Stephania yunnanensis TaxID=152371 RepID=A0AAP0EQL3_9MAGN
MLKTVRGDIARALLYMAVRYGFNQNNESLNLHLSDSPSMKNREMGLLSTLLKWNELDPPSRAEKIRNNRVCLLYQHNRNPFVDHPEFANLIWKQSFPDIASRNKPPEAWINEFHYNNRGKDQNEFVEIVVGPSTEAENIKLVLYNGANGRVYRSLSLADREIFHVTLVGNGFSIYTVFLPLQNGPGDAISLVLSREDSRGGEVIQFVSYEGAVRAIDGPAKGNKSKDIGLEETNESSENDSLGLTGAGIAEFKWRKFINQASPSELNGGQSLS